MFSTISHLFLILVLVACVSISIRFLLYRTALIFLVQRWIHWIEDRVHVHQYYKVPEFDENLQENQFYTTICTYLNSLTSLEDSDFTNLVTGKGPNDIVLSLDDNQTVQDKFLGARISWKNDVSENKTFILRIKKKDKGRILRPYFQHIHTVSYKIEQRRGRDIKMYTSVNGRWRSIPFNHPSTFDTIVMDEHIKNKMKSDLESFLKTEKYYRRLGRTWQRSYLLYGPSGTGKSSFVAAMAKFLNYDVYEVDLSSVSCGTYIKILLSQARKRSMIVVEDLDQFNGAGKFPTLLNFMDKFFNTGDERVMVFTMNDKEKVDPALLRPGRIDVQLYFPHCNFDNFKNMASGYLGIKDHKLYSEVKEAFQGRAKMSAAEVGEIMIANRGSPSSALRSVIAAAINSGGGGGDMAEEERRKSGGLLPVKELKKLYGLWKMRSCSEVHLLDHQ